MALSSRWRPGRGPENSPIAAQVCAPGPRRIMLPQGGLPMPPSKLAHVVFQTNRIKELRDWYCAVLEGQVIYENPHLSFVSYDDEHHRVAFVDFAPLSARDPNTELMVKSSEQPGLHHVAFTFASMREL